MTPEQFKAARRSLTAKDGKRLSATQFGRMIGYKGEHVRIQIHEMDRGVKNVGGAHTRLIEMYLTTDYRPDDWPEKGRGRERRKTTERL